MRWILNIVTSYLRFIIAMVVVFFGVLLLLTLVQLWAWRLGGRKAT